MGIKIPKHIDPNDLSEAADLQRFHHAQEMQSLANGGGFRQPSTKATKKHNKTRYEHIAERVLGNGQD